MKWITPHEAYSRSTILTGFDEWAAEQDVDYLAMLDRFGIPRLALRNPNLFISHDRLGQFLEEVARCSGNPNIGLHGAYRLSPDFPNFGSLVQVARFCVSLRDWIAQASRLACLQTNAWLPHLEERADGLASFRLIQGPLRRMPRQLCEATLATMFMLVRELTEEHQSTALRVCFQHDAPADLSLHHEIFGCELHFGCDQNGFLFDARHLDAPIVGRLAKFRGIFNAYVKAQIRKLTTRDMSVRTAVYAAIANMTGTEVCTAERIAELLGMSEKKMQRLLRAEGTSFRAEATRVREDLSADMLVKTTLPIGEIAVILGYSSNAAFTLAFTKMTGQSPSQYRASHVLETSTVMASGASRVIAGELAWTSSS